MGRVGIAGSHGRILSMQVTWHHLTSPTSSNRRLPCKVWRKCLNLFRFQHGIAKGVAKWMVEPPNIVYGLVGIGAYTRTVSEEGTYHPVYIWLAFRSVVPGC